MKTRFRTSFLAGLTHLLVLGVVLVEPGHCEEGFKALLRGDELSNWTTEGNWVLEEEGVLAIKPRPGEEGWKRFEDYLWADQQYGNFVLELEYKHPEGGNSGVFLRVGDREDPVATGIEVQILDSYAKQGELTPHDNGGVISAVAPSKNASKPAGQWNKLRITAQGSQLQVELNGQQIIDADLEQTPLKDRPAKGYLGLQDHGQLMWFRNVRIKPLE